MNKESFIEREARIYKELNGKEIDVEKILEALKVISKQGHSGSSAGYLFSYLGKLLRNEEETRTNLEHILEKSKADNDPNDVWNAYSMQKLITNNIFEVYEVLKDLPVWQKELAVQLLKYRPITPLLGTDDEWDDTSEWGLGENQVAHYQNNRCSSVFKTVYKNGLVICHYLDDRVFSDNGGISYFTTGRFGRRQITFPYEIPKHSEEVYLFEAKKDFYIELTDPETIKQYRKICREERDNEE